MDCTYVVFELERVDVAYDNGYDVLVEEDSDDFLRSTPRNKEKER